MSLAPSTSVVPHCHLVPWLCCCVGFHAPALIPLLVVFCITSIETVGDVTATEEASRLAVVGEAHTVRVRGALLNDGEQLLSATAFQSIS